MTHQEQRLRINSEGDTVLAVFAVREMASKIGMSAGAASALATAVSELTTNVIKYAKDGRITIRAVRRRSQPGLEVLVEDRGLGIEDVEDAMRDHVSSGGTLGLGLPGTKRLVEEIEIDSRPGQGTRIRIVKWG